MSQVQSSSGVLEAVSKMDDVSSVAVWPASSHEVEEYGRLLENENIDTVYLVTGSESPDMSLREKFSQDSRVSFPNDIFQSSVFSHQIPDLVEQGLMEPVDLEYARDVAMDIFYHPCWDEGKGDTSPEVFQEVFRDTLETSWEIAQQGSGYLLWDLHDYDPAGLLNDPMIEVAFHDAETQFKRDKYHEKVQSALDSAFHEVDSWEREVSYDDDLPYDLPSYDSKVFMAHNPREEIIGEQFRGLL